MLEHVSETKGEGGGVVAAGHPEVAEAGAAALRRGGNAVDAVVASMFAAFTAEPLLCSAGGAGFMLVHIDGEARAYDFFSTAPGLGERETPYQPTEASAFFGVEVDFGAARQVFHIGPGSISVPGALAGLCQAQSEAGRLTLAEVLEPGYELALGGALITEMGAYVPQLLEPIIRSRPEFERLFVDADGALKRAGQRFSNPELASFYTELASTSSTSRLLYTGPLAEQMLEHIRAEGGGLTRADLERYEVRICAPVRCTLDGVELFMTPAPSSGGMLIAYGLKLLEGAPAARAGSAEEVLLLRAVMSETLRARAEIVGDRTPDDACAERLLDPAYVEAGIGRARRLLERGASDLPTAVPDNLLGSTTHISAIDQAGNAAAVTISSGECSGLVVPGAGIFLNNFLGEEDLNPQGFHRFPPGVRLGSTMCPVLARASRSIAAMGSGGSNRIRTALLQVLRNLITHDMSPGAAVHADRLHFEEGVLYAEGANVHRRSIAGLAERGLAHSLFPEQSMFFGGVHLAERLADGVVIGVGDGRRSGAVALEKR